MQVQRVAGRFDTSAKIGQVKIPAAVQVDIAGGDAHRRVGVVAHANRVERPVGKTRARVVLENDVARPGQRRVDVTYIHVRPEVIVQVRRHERQAGTVIGTVVDRYDADGVGNVGKRSIAQVAVEAILVACLAMLLPVPVTDIEIDVSVAIVIQPATAGGAIRRTVGMRFVQKIFDPGGHRNDGEKGLPRQHLPSILDPEVLQQDVDRPGGRPDRAGLVVREDVNIGIAVVVKIGEYGTHHFDVRQRRKQGVLARESAIALVAEQVGAAAIEAVDQEEVRPPVLVVVNPVDAQTVRRGGDINIVADAGLGAHLREAYLCTDASGGHGGCEERRNSQAAHQARPQTTCPFACHALVLFYAMTEVTARGGACRIVGRAANTSHLMLCCALYCALLLLFANLADLSLRLLIILCARPM